jgi:hypothetical protein
MEVMEKSFSLFLHFSESASAASMENDFLHILHVLHGGSFVTRQA